MLHIKSALDSERLDRVERDLREVGFHIIENVITDDEADEAREVIWKLVEEDIANGFDHSYGDGKIRRVWAIVGKSASSAISSSTRRWSRSGNGCSAKMSSPPRLQRILSDPVPQMAVGISITRIGRCNLLTRPVQ